MTLKVRILGCGSSGGVPRVGSGWGACDPLNPKNRRRRCSILVTRTAENGGRTEVLVDTSPDLREQLLDAQVNALDGVLFTHAHADHTHGLDDLRPLAIHMKARVPVWCDETTSADLHARFGYCFTTPKGSEYPPILIENRLRVGEPVTVTGEGGPVTGLPIRLLHGAIEALGFRFGDIAYTSDLHAIPAESVPLLEGLDVWIIDALRYSRHPSHFSLAEALDWIDRLKPRRAVLTNLHTDLDHAVVAAQVPAHVMPAHDGLEITAR